jgi:hypothetical protein
MNSVDAVSAQLSSPAWWLSVILVGFLLNLFSSYARDLIDRNWSRLSQKRFERSQKRHEDLKAEANAALLGASAFPAWTYLYLKANSEAMAALVRLLLAIVALGLGLIIFFMKKNGIGVGASAIGVIALLMATRDHLLIFRKIDTANRILDEVVRENSDNTSPD